MSWLSDKQLNRAIWKRGDTKCLMAFRGIYPLDQLPLLDMTPPLFIIFNTHIHNLSGQHWKAIFIDTDYCGEVFDSLATPTSDAIIRFMNKYSRKWTTNSLAYQHPLSSQCGAYVLYFVTQRLYYSSLEDFCKTFTLDTLLNEKMMSDFYNTS